MNHIIFIIKYIIYLFTAKTPYGIHSPFVFDLTTNVINSNSRNPAYDTIENIRAKLLKNKKSIPFEEMGALKNKKNINSKTIAEIAAWSAKPPKYTQLIFRLIQKFKPHTILEIGTSLGITTAHMALAQPDANIYTMEGNESVSKQAFDNFKELNILNIKQITGNFNTVLPAFLKGTDKLDFVFFDGNHLKAPTLSYFEQCLNHIHNQTVFLFDDIHWSKEMEEAWEIIKKSPEVKLTIDLFFVGLVFFRKESTKEHFIIRF